jgi:tRNA pseudouridine55 synthase
MYSALKVNGQKLCDLARAGKEVEREARKVTFHEIEILSMELPIVKLRVKCSKGTYIRALARDIGQRLQSGAHLIALRRTRVGDIRVEDCMTFEQFTNLINNEIK